MFEKIDSFILDHRIRLPTGKCHHLENVPCSKCAKYYGGNTFTEDGKCVYVPKYKSCKSKAWAVQKRHKFDDTCAGN